MPWDDNDQLHQSEALLSILWDKALEIGNKHLLNSERVYRILRHSVRDYPGPYSFREPPAVTLSSSYAVKFAPDLVKALAHLSPPRALEIFEQYHPDQLMGYEMAFEYLFRGRAPFWTWDELAEVLRIFQKHLLANRKSLLATGIPITRFMRSEMLDRNLNKLLYTKMPLLYSWTEFFFLAEQWYWSEGFIKGDEAGYLGLDSDGNPRLAHYWTRELIVFVGFDEVAYRRPHEHRDSMRAPDVPTCEYEEAPILTGLDPEHAQRLAALRPKVFELKMAILDVLIQALDTRSGTSVWSKTTEVISDGLTSDETGFLLETEKFFRQYPCDDFLWPAVGRRGLSVGGLRDVFEVVGHVECELAIGPFHKSKQRVVTQPPPEITSFYEVLEQAWHSELTNALGEFLVLSRMSQGFWDDFAARVNGFCMMGGMSLPAAAKRVQARGAERFPTPAGARWNETLIRFLDGHTVSIRVRGQVGTYNYTQMRMVNRRNGGPTEQWYLLLAFAKRCGTLTWDHPDANRKNQKRKERLAGSLREFFGIIDDPFEATDGGWRSKFQVEPD